MNHETRPQPQRWGLQMMLATTVSAAITCVGMLGYDHFVIQPGKRLGVVDLAAVYRAKEDEYARAFYKAAALESGSNQGMRSAGPVPDQLALDFARRLPIAMEELRRECRCMVVVRGAVATLGEGMVDLTPVLREKLGMRP